MGRTLSVYLDLLRFLAAVSVVLHHLAPLSGRYSVFGRYGDDAVMVFFVLSGFVIAHVTHERERTLGVYSASRLARLYSVAIPALALTLLLDLIGRSFGGAYPDNDSHPWIRMAVSLSFTNQLWGADIRPWSNVPYWSISYEFWYYAFFAIIAFARRKALFLAAWAVVVGPCILLLLPVWYVGVWAYRFRPKINALAGWILFLGSPALYGIYNLFDLREAVLGVSDALVATIVDPYSLHKARFFLHDYCVGLMVTAHFIGAATVCQSFSFGALTTPIRRVAAYTFTLYLLHYPLQSVIISIHPIKSWIDDVAVWVGTALAVYAVGLVTERRKDDLRALFIAIFNLPKRDKAPDQVRA